MTAASAAEPPTIEHLTAAATLPDARPAAAEPLRRASSGVGAELPAERRRQLRRLGTAILRVRPGAAVSLRAAPDGEVIGQVGERTEFGSEQTLTVAKRRGRWLGVITPKRPNGRLAWVDGRSRKLERGRTRVSLRVDLSRHRLELRVGSRTRRAVRVGIGGPASPTPTGRFAVTDKLAGARFSPVYGCCILALSGNQTRLPAGWRGGTRLAIHGGGATSGSAGCLRAREEDLRVLMRAVPLGTPVRVVD